MLKIRMIPTLLWKNLSLVKGIGFDSWRRVGTVLPAVKVYNLRDVDELILLDILATQEKRQLDCEALKELSAECFVPLTVGGGVKTVEDVRRLLESGADKVAMNTAAIETPELIGQAAGKFGSQCIVVSIDARKMPDGGHQVFTRSGKKASGKDPVSVARKAAEMGAGEILLTSIDRDGTMSGYDLELVKKVAEAVSIPLIASGGAGDYEHMADALLKGHASAVAAASLFHFTEQTPREAKRYLSNKGLKVRL